MKNSYAAEQTSIGTRTHSIWGQDSSGAGEEGGQSRHAKIGEGAAAQEHEHSCCVVCRSVRDRYSIPN